MALKLSCVDGKAAVISEGGARFFVYSNAKHTFRSGTLMKHFEPDNRSMFPRITSTLEVHGLNRFTMSSALIGQT